MKAVSPKINLYLAAATAVVSGVSLSAQTATWDAQGGNASISTLANWLGDTLPANDGTVTAIFGTGGTSALADTNYNFAGITFNRDASFVINDGAATAITLGSGGLTINQPNSTNRTYTINEALTLSANQTWQGGGSSTGNTLYNVAGPISGGFQVTKSGAGVLGLTGNNSNWTGSSGVGLVIGSNSEVRLPGTNAGSALGTGAVRFDAGGTLNLGTNSGSVTTGNNFSINNTATTNVIGFSSVAGAGSVWNLSGNFTRSSTPRLRFNPTSTTNGEGRINLSGDWSGYSASASNNEVWINTVGTLQIQSASALAPSGISYIFNGVGLDTGNTSAKLVFNFAGTVANPVLFGNNGTAQNSNSVGTIIASGQTTTLGGTVTNNNASGVNLFALNEGSFLNVSGVATGNTGAWNINRSFSYVGTAGQAASMQSPVGTVKLSRSAGTSITNDLIIHGGSLLANNTSGSAFTGNATVNLGATLGGTGFITPAIGKTITVNGIIAPGDGGIGTLTLSGINTALAVATFGNGASFKFDLNAGLASDRLTLTNGAAGDFGFNNNVINFIDLTDGSLAFGQYTIFAGGVTGAFSGLSVSGTAITGGLSIGTGLEAYNTSLELLGNNIVLNVAAIPEPSTFAVLGGLATLGFVSMRRNRR